MRVWILMLALIATGPVLALSGASQQSDDLYLVVLPPWADRAVLVRRLDGQWVGPASAPFGALLQTDLPDVAGVARSAGAWWVTSGAAMAAICGVEV